ncbi:response regulator [Marinoscillum furvescens]|uniref:LuxR family two component transcriptional regulator n=1 Tax=Marinoscillum furvescens DSM 4134 TaxID=1122208 RepID=A0A3D9L027_MARFU|nr:response regulator transcription factor [Marinoscillum furvescens]RED95261.1 LuxR family two component transcriptional regulator [Marinoscillum furvescens DSM 4134]
MIQALLVEDHDLFAEGMKSMFQPEDGITIVAHTKNGHETPSLLEEHQIDVILMDIDMPILDGVTTLKMIKKRGFDHPTLMLTMHQSMRFVKEALEKGAQGYILKDASKPELIEAIRTVSARKNYFHPKVNEQVFDYFRNRGKSQSGLNELSEREKEIIKCLAEGMNSKAIANALCISEHTVKTHRRNIMHKMHVNTSAELVRQAMEQGIIEMG